MNNNRAHLDFHISYTCLNKCLFCSSADSIEKFNNHPLKLEDILMVLEKKKKKGFKSVNFTGGEPTLFKKFPELVRETKNLGYRIYVGTGGGKFEKSEFVRKTAPFIDEVCFSFHGHNSSLHNFHTQNADSFERLEKAVRNLLKFPIRFSSNTVITKYNLPYLDKILEFLAKLGVEQSMLSNLAPEGRGLKNYSDLAVRLSDLRKKIPNLVKIAEKKNVILRFFGLPLCLLGEYASYSNDLHWDERINIEQAKKGNQFYLKEEKAKITRSRIKTEKCNSCSYNKICGGVFDKYYKMFGDGELTPI